MIDCNLFKGLFKDDLTKIVDKYSLSTKSYKKNSFIAFEGEDCYSLGIIISGSVDLLKIYPSGNSLTLNKLNEKEIFGEGIIFSKNHKYPVTIKSNSDCEIMFLSNEVLLDIFNSNDFILKNFLQILSEKLIFLNSKSKMLALPSIKSKISFFLLEEYKEQNSLFIDLGMSKKELAQKLGIPRPSLSRELIKLKDNSIIDFNGRIIKIINLNELEDILYE